MSKKKDTIENILDGLEKNDTSKKDKDEKPTEKGIVEKIFTANSPNKDLKEYESHPLNYSKDESMSRIIRGLEGLAGSLDKAFIDIGVGVLQKISQFYKRVQEEKERTQ